MMKYYIKNNFTKKFILTIVCNDNKESIIEIKIEYDKELNDIYLYFQYDFIGKYSNGFVLENNIYKDIIFKIYNYLKVINKENEYVNNIYKLFRNYHTKELISFLSCINKNELARIPIEIIDIIVKELIYIKRF